MRASGYICRIAAAAMTRPLPHWICTPEPARRRVMPETSWHGYMRADGRKGVRNLILVIYTVQCAQFVAHCVAQNEPETHVIGFPGCYDNEYAGRLLLAL